MDKNLKHLLDISPYRVSTESPFNMWEVQSESENKKFLIIFYSKQSEYWNSLKKINHWVLEQIYLMKSECIPYTIDINQPNIWEQYQGILSKCGAIVCFGLNKNVSEVVKNLRKANSQIPMNIFHTTSNKSWGYQFKYFGLDLISKNDYFFCLCEQDKKVLARLFPNNKINIFTPKTTKAISKNKTGDKDLVYFGRVSFEKNIHWILAGLAAYRNRYRSNPPKLNIFGEEDILGRKSLVGQVTYKELLLSLIKELELEDFVIFHGYQNQKTLFKYLKESNDVGVFLSTYDTENFGLAPREILEHGNSLILSAWGAFNDIIKASESSKKLSYVYPTLCPAGVQFNPFELAQRIHLMQVTEIESQKEFTINESLPKINTKSSEYVPIDKKVLLEHQCLSPQAKQSLFFKYYANTLNSPIKENDQMTLNPFIEIQDDSVHSKLDGRIIFKGKNSEEKCFNLLKLNGQRLKVSKSIYHFLTANSFIF